MIAPSRAALPMPPKIARGVPAAIPQAPATMTTDIVDRVLWVMKNVIAAAVKAK